MSQGKFSNPRPHREEEREIEKAYRDLTRKQSHKTYEHRVTAEDMARAAQPLPTDEDVPDIAIPNSVPAEEAFPTEDAFPELFASPEAVPSADTEDRLLGQRLCRAFQAEVRASIQRLLQERLAAGAAEPLGAVIQHLSNGLICR